MQSTFMPAIPRRPSEREPRLPFLPPVASVWQRQTHSHFIRSRLQTVDYVRSISLAIALDLFVAQIPQDGTARTGQDKL